VLGLAVLVVQLTLAVGAFNRAPHAGGDSATYISLAHSLLDDGSYTEVYDPERLPHTKYPPVFPALLAVWIALGATTWTALKTTAVLFSAAAVVLAYAWVSERRGPLIGASVAFLFAVSSASIDASHWILSEPPFLAFTMLALWAFERADRREGKGHGTAGGAAAGAPTSSGNGTTACATLPTTGQEMARWVSGPGGATALGTAATLLAYFTRSAGLPLLLAGVGWLALERRWKALSFYVAGSSVPIVLWWLRSLGVDRPSYIGEFWMVNPYQPALGTVDVLGLAGRFWVNLVGYTTRHVPAGIVGARGIWVAALGLALVALAAVGWYRAARARLGVAELFLPLYVGLILIWPEVWSGDRFALPLFPLLFFYAGDALLDGASHLGRPAVVGAGTSAILLLAGPALSAWTRSVSVARTCAAAARTAGPFGCYGEPVQEFVRTALWSRTALPEGSAVLSRKPSIFYVMSGVPSRTFPFSLDPEVLFAEARATGSRYVVLDRLDLQAVTFVGEAVARQPKAFCAVGGFDPRAGGGGGTLILGIMLDVPPSGLPEPSVSVGRCPPEMLGDITWPIPDYSSSRVPLLSSTAPAPWKSASAMPRSRW
jgi:hypothetical protein